MQAVDVTGMNEEQIEELEKGGTNLRVGEDGVARPANHFTIKVPVVPLNQVPQSKVPVLGAKKLVKRTKANEALFSKYGERIFCADGRVNYKVLPTDDLAKRIMRRETESRIDLFDQLGKKFMSSFLSKIPKTSLKLKSKAELKKNVRKFLDLAPEKSKTQKKREQKKKEKKSQKEPMVVGPVNHVE